MNQSDDPFASPVPAEVPLPHAPLVRVIAQVRFPSILSLEKRDLVAPFQEAIRADYPVLRVEQTRTLLLGPEGPAGMTPAVIWRFNSLDEKWRVSLAMDFVAIETTAYQSRGDLLTRLDNIVGALAEHVGPQTLDRLGVRYIDRLTGEAVKNLGTLVRKDVLGVYGTAAARHASHALTEVLFSLPQGSDQMRARWGLIPPGGTVDPAAIEPIVEPSWILDLDTYSSEPRPFSPASILSDARAHAERSYCFFRWVVTEEFLRHYGGKP